MPSKKDIDNLIDKVLQSKKYRSLHRPTVRRIVEDTIPRYPKKEGEKAVKRRLHQIWGAYFTRPNFEKLLVKIEEELKNGVNIKTIVLSILKLQTSTNERIPILNDFYPQIFSVTGHPKTIIEPACGLNALTYFWMDPDVQYTGFDIDQEQIDFINNVFHLLRVQKRARVELGDVLVEDFNRAADVVLLLKVLPLLEHQQKVCSIQVLRKIQCKNMVVSFPTRSISGKNKGMADFYTKQFMDLTKDEPWQIEKLLFETELVFIVKKES